MWWSIGLLESRTRPGPATLRHHDAVIATFRAAGFSPVLTAQAYALVGTYVYGFARQEPGKRQPCRSRGLRASAKSPSRSCS